MNTLRDREAYTLYKKINADVSVFCDDNKTSHWGDRNTITDVYIPNGSHYKIKLRNYHKNHKLHVVAYIAEKKIGSFVLNENQTGAIDHSTTSQNKFRAISVDDKRGGNIKNKDSPIHGRIRVQLQLENIKKEQKMLKAFYNPDEIEEEEEEEKLWVCDQTDGGPPQRGLQVQTDSSSRQAATIKSKELSDIEYRWVNKIDVHDFTEQFHFQLHINEDNDVDGLPLEVEM
ncbi:DhNV_077 [Dikerogammarus haemobaphes nudivirus]|nr:DhNV_077 [Dikerogammarus haemobaphes nudivirus]